MLKYISWHFRAGVWNEFMQFWDMLLICGTNYYKGFDIPDWILPILQTTHPMVP